MNYELSEDEDEDPKKRDKKNEMIARRMKANNPDLQYIKISFRGKNLRRFPFRGKKVQNVYDFYEIRKNTYKMKENEEHTYENVIGGLFYEYNYNDEKDLKF